MQDMPQVGLAGPRRIDAGGISDLFPISSTETPLQHFDEVNTRVIRLKLLLNFVLGRHIIVGEFTRWLVTIFTLLYVDKLKQLVGRRVTQR